MKYLLLFLLVIISSCKTSLEADNFDYPKTIPQSEEEVFNHVTIIDDYKYLQNTTDPSVKDWYLEQTNFTDSVLQSYTDVDSIEARLERNALDKIESAKWFKHDSQGGLYYIKSSENESIEFLVFRKDFDSEEIILFDPKTYKSDSDLEYYIDHINPSWDGNYVSISLRHSNTFESEIVILDVNTGKLTNDLITNCRGNAFGGIQWSPDSSGFTYLYFPVLDKNEEGYLTNSVMLYHALHTGSDKGIFAFGNSDSLEIKPEIFPLVSFTSGSDPYAIGYVMDNTHYYKTYYAKAEELKHGNPNWKPLYDSSHVIYGNEALPYKDQLFFMSAKDAPNFEIKVVDNETMDFSNSKTVVPQMKDEVINDFEFVKEGMYYTTTKNGVEAKLYFKNKNDNIEVILPFTVGDIEIFTKHGEGNAIIIECSGWSNDLIRIKVDNGKVIDEISFAARPIRPDFKNLVSEEIIIKGHDGAEIPVSLIYDKTLGKEDRPSLIESYGAYGHNMDPYFSSIKSTWIPLGGIRVIAHIRGGGEKGKAWHDAGKKETKSNSWKDIISVTEYLIEQGYTAADKTVLYTASAGGVSQAMAAIKRPELFAVMMAKVPLLNPLKLKEGSNKQLSFTEFGDIDIAEEVPHLLNLDPYHNLVDISNFPPTLFFAAGKDDRLDLWETGKFTAKLQNSNSSRGPYLLKVMPEWGHGSSDNRSYAELFSFALNNIASSDK